MRRSSSAPRAAPSPPSCTGDPARLGDAPRAVVHAIPVLAVRAWAMTRPLTAKAAIDFNMVFLMAAQPAYAARGDVATTSSFGLAVVLGVLAATIFFHAAHESRRERIARLTREVVRELRRLAASGGPDVAGSRSAAMTDRVVRMAMGLPRGRPDRAGRGHRRRSAGTRAGKKGRSSDSSR